MRSTYNALRRTEVRAASGGAERAAARLAISRVSRAAAGAMGGARGKKEMENVTKGGVGGSGGSEASGERGRGCGPVGQMEHLGQLEH